MARSVEARFPLGGKPTARRLCLAALRNWRTTRVFADAILHRYQRDLASHTERALLTALFYGVLRNLTLLDLWIAQLASRPPDEDLRDLLRMGLFQTLIESFADHAAVNETVALAPRNAVGFANAVLREGLRRRLDFHSALPHLPLHVRWSHPRFLVDRWEALFGQPACSALCAWNHTPAAVTARVNVLRGTRDELLKRPAARVTANAHHPMAVTLSGLPGDLVSDGFIYPQDPSAMRVVDLLDPQPNERILDACAAPGGKATDIAARIANCGEVLATDLSHERLRLVEENASRLGVTCIRVQLQDWLRCPVCELQMPTNGFDRVLVDAPCTNTGVLRRRVDARWRLSADDFRVMPEIQRRLLDAVAPLVRAGGVLLYSTCSIDPEENAGVAAAFAATHPDFSEQRRVAFFPPDDGVDGGFAVCWKRD